MTTILDELLAMYASVPAVHCQHKCGSGVCGAIIAYPIEIQRMEDLARRPLTFSTATLTCGYYAPIENRCLVYDVRPLICRLYGAVQHHRMRCPFGCVPDRWLSHGDVQTMLDRLEILHGGNPSLGREFTVARIGEAT